jgi:hypothetical protein
MTASTPEEIEAYRLLALRAGLKLESVGLKTSKGKSAFSIVKKMTGLPGRSAKELLPLYEDLLREYGILSLKKTMTNPVNRFDKTLQRYHGGDDPSRQEMIEHIKGVYGREADRFDIEEAIYWFSNDYHGGQGSNLYSALSKSEYRPGRSSSGPEEGSMAEMIYTDLVDTFSPKKNPVRRRKGESERKFVSRCMSEEKESFPKQKQRIAVCLSKARKNPLLESGATISKNSGINRRAASMT